jgi:hypothetical protein
VEVESELARRETIWVRGTTDSLLGTAILTGDRLLFFHTKFASGGAGGILSDLVADTLQKRYEKGGPALDLPLDAITGMHRERKFLARNRLAISTADAEYLFSDGWNEWGPLLRDTLAGRLGRKVVEESADAWRVEPS